jgi:hypothetical protein
MNCGPPSMSYAALPAPMPTTGGRAIVNLLTIESVRRQEPIGWGH